MYKLLDIHSNLSTVFAIAICLYVIKIMMKVFPDHFWLCSIVEVSVDVFFQGLKSVITMQPGLSLGGTPIHFDPIGFAMVLRVHFKDMACTFYNFSQRRLLTLEIRTRSKEVRSTTSAHPTLGTRTATGQPPGFAFLNIK